MEKKILKLLLTPFVENAVYHGLETKMGDGNIWITGQVNENRIIFTIIDDGVGIDDMSKLDKGYGINNVRERIKLYYGENSEVTITSEPGKGTTITILFENAEKSVTM